MDVIIYSYPNPNGLKLIAVRKGSPRMCKELALEIHNEIM